MRVRALFALSGLVVGAIVNVLLNLLSAGLQQRFPPQFSDQLLWGLVGLSLFGLLVGYWLSGPVQMPTPASLAPSSPAPQGSADTVTITRLRAFLSYSKLKGRGIHLRDILLFGSRIDIET